MSTYFGEDLTAYLEAFRNGEDATYVPGKNMLNIGVKDIAAIKILLSAKDYNRSFGASTNVNAAT